MKKKDELPSFVTRSGFDFSNIDAVNAKEFRIEQWEKENSKAIREAHKKLNSYTPGASNQDKRNAKKQEIDELKAFKKRQQRRKKNSK